MLRMTWYTLLFQGIPETVAITAVVFALLRLDLNWRLILPVGLAEGLAAYLIRLLPIPFGVHTVFLMFVLMGLVRLATREDMVAIVRSVLIVNMIIPVLELLGTGSLFRILGVTYADVAEKWYWPLLGWPHVIALYLLAFALDRRNRRRKEASRGGPHEAGGPGG
ncbi:MAG: hypothetical protein H5T97_13540 [Firmicutes bacterium]|nr:hypothetical protein [Bacillota bacterium]